MITSPVSLLDAEIASVTNFSFNSSRMAKEDKSKGIKANRSANYVVKPQLNVIKVSV